MASRWPADAPTRKLPSATARLRLLVWWVVIKDYNSEYKTKTPGKPVIVHGDDIIAQRATKQVDYSILVSYADYFFCIDSLMDTVHPVIQQRWMDALLAATVSKEKQRPLLDISKSSGHLNSTNLNPSASKKNSSRFTSKNPGETHLSASNSNLLKMEFITK